MNNYWDDIAEQYHHATHISCDDFHYGPLIAGDRDLGLLPEPLIGKSCLELGCGAAQNSIYLARKGAICTAVDSSPAQLSEARKLANDAGVSLDLQLLDLNSALPANYSAAFDLVHSAYALPFVDSAELTLRNAIDCLKPGGWLLLSTAHPLFNHDWADFEDGEIALIVGNYFQTPEDLRISPTGNRATCRPVPIANLLNTIADEGLALKRFLEPKPAVRLNDCSFSQCPAPYDSEGWRELLPQLERVPAVIIILAQKWSDI